MLFKGSKRFATGAIDRAVVEAGGILNAFTDADFTAYFTTLPRQHADLSLRIEADRMRGATIPQVEIDKERAVVLSERDMNQNQPEFKVEEEIFALAFREHPYRWDALGYAQDIRAMDRAHLYEFYQRFYGPRNATLVVVGGFDPRVHRRNIERLFGGIDAGVESPDVAVVEPPQGGERRARIQGPGSTPLVRLAWRVPEIADPRAGLFLLLDLHLGGETALYPTGGMWGRSREHPSARLHQALVDTGLAVRAGSDWRPRLNPSLFSMQAQAVPGVSGERLETALLAEAERLVRRPLEAKILRRLKESLVQGSKLSWEGSSRAGFRLGYFRTLGDLRWERGILERALRATPVDLQRAAEALFVDGSRTVVHFEAQGEEGSS